MKFNWGTRIVLSFIGFIGFIMYFVIRMNTDSMADHELVSTDYYQRELAYQSEIDAEKNAHARKAHVALTKTDQGLRIRFPDGYRPDEITGKVSLYRPSNKHLDFDLDIQLSDSHLLIPDSRLLEGRWDISIAWSYRSESFLQKSKLTY